MDFRWQTLCGVFVNFGIRYPPKTIVRNSDSDGTTPIQSPRRLPTSRRQRVIVFWPRDPGCREPVIPGPLGIALEPEILGKFPP